MHEIATKHSNVTANRSLSIIKKVFVCGLRLKAVINDPVKNVEFLSEKEHKRNRFLLPKELDHLVKVPRK